ncbi:MAG: PH domain-containing protein [Candidatus Parcubacteria bacterium]|nr:PH domain-containing protein [Candidatus Parcubacteria bacterium]
MSDQYFAKKINLHAEEEIIGVLHHHPVTYAKQIAITTVLILGSFFLMFYLFSLGELGVALFCAIILTGLFYGGREFFIWYANSVIITNQRLVDIDQLGFFHKTVSDISYEKFLDISYSVKGVWQTIFHIGTIKVQSTGAALVLRNIQQPGKVNQLLADLIKEQTGKNIEIKKVASLSPQIKEKLRDDFVRQDELAEYEEYNLNELIEEYKDTFGELSLKKLIVDELEEKEATEAKEAKPADLVPEKKVEDDIEGNFRKKHL